MKFFGYIFLFLFVKVSFAQKDSIVSNDYDLNKSKPEIFTVVEEMPQYPGGQLEMMRYIQKNMVYPLKAKEEGWGGKVFLKFIVRADGVIDSVVVLKSTRYNVLDDEGVRVVKSMPNWTPGKQNGRPVSVYFNLPISFKTIETGKGSYREEISTTEGDNFLLAEKNYNLGTKEYEKGNIDRAIYYYKETLKYKDSDIDALYNLGVIYQKQGDSKNSCEMFNKIKSFGKHDADAVIKKYCSN